MLGSRGRHPGLNTWLYLKQNGLNPDEDQVEIVEEVRIEHPDGTKEVSKKTLLDMIRDGDIDACFMNHPKVEFARRAGLKIIDLPVQPMVFFMTMSSSKNMVDKHPEIVTRNLRPSWKASLSSSRTVRRLLKS